MIDVRPLALAASALLLGAACRDAQDLSRDREFQLGSTWASVQTIRGTTADVRMIHQRSAVMDALRLDRDEAPQRELDRVKKNAVTIERRRKKLAL